MKTIYKILFSIKIYHDYYNSLNSINYLDIIPSPDSIEKLNRFRTLFRKFSNEIVILGEVNSDDKPFIEIPGNTFFRFYLKILKPEFQNISALKTFDTEGKIYYFTNYSDNKFEDKLYLSRPMPGFDPGVDYEVGSLVQDNSLIFEAVQFCGKNSGHSTTDSNYWRKLPADRFPSYEDNTALSDIYKGELASSNGKIFEAKNFIPKNTLFKIANNNYWKEINNVQYVTHIDLVDKATLGIKENIFGIIDLFFDDSVKSDFSILGSKGKVKGIEYFIRFKNRISTWKYISLYNGVDKINDENNIFTFTKKNLTGKEFISTFPIPLMAKPLYNFSLKAGPIILKNIKTASAVIKPEIKTKSFISEIFLNH